MERSFRRSTCRPTSPSPAWTASGRTTTRARAIRRARPWPKRWPRRRAATAPSSLPPAWRRSPWCASCSIRATGSSRPTTATAARSGSSTATGSGACSRVDFVDLTDAESMTAALASRPKLVLVETPSNPLLRITDLEAVCPAREAGRRAGRCRQHVHVAGAPAAPRVGRRRRGPLHDQVPERPQRCRRRRSGGSHRGAPRVLRGVGEHDGRRRRALRQLPDPARPAHPCTAGCAATRRTRSPSSTCSPGTPR